MTGLCKSKGCFAFDAQYLSFCMLAPPRRCCSHPRLCFHGSFCLKPLTHPLGPSSSVKLFNTFLAEFIAPSSMFP